MQDKIIEKKPSINRTRPINNDRVEKDLSAAINVLCSFLEKENLAKSNTPHLLQAPVGSEIRKGIQKNMQIDE